MNASYVEALTLNATVAYIRAFMLNVRNVKALNNVKTI